MYNINLTEFIELKEKYSGMYYPLTFEIMSDLYTPINILNKLKNESNHTFLLESVDKEKRWGRFSFLGFNPKLEINCTDHKIQIKEKESLKELEGNPNEVIREILNKYKCVKTKTDYPFTGGLVGYFSYDYIKYKEPKLKLKAQDNEYFKDVDLMLFDTVICFDNSRQMISIIVNANIDDGEKAFNKAKTKISSILKLIENTTTPNNQGGKLLGEITPQFKEKQFCSMVEKAKYYIKEGDIFQVVLSNTLTAPFEGSLFNTYRQLRVSNPSPYMFYFSGCDVEIAGASPETLVKLENENLYTFPLAGTRKRGKTKEEDILLEEQLLNDEKELSEHNMLVDLGRNDLGQVCEFNSITVEEYLKIHRFSTVMHIGSCVKGKIRKDKDALDAIQAVLPAGTLSGAPKIRACEIIDELENNKRGLYGGAIGYIGFNNNMDTCIAIRIAYKKNGKVFIRSGAGIVADSDPVKEHQECLNKAKSVINVLTKED